MLAKLTLLAATAYPQIGGLDYPLEVSTAYVFNTNRIRSAIAYDTTDVELEYVFEPDSRRASYAIFRVDGTIASLVTTCDTALDDTLIALSVIVDYEGTTVAQTRYFNANDIIICDEYDTNKTRVDISMGGASVKSYTVTEDLDEIIALVTA